MFEKQAKITQLEAELSKRMVATTSAPTPLAPAPAPPQQASLVTNLPAILDVLKKDLGQSGQAHNFLSE